MEKFIFSLLEGVKFCLREGDCVFVGQHIGIPLPRTPPLAHVWAGATSSASPRSDGAGAIKGSGSPPCSVWMGRMARADKLESLLYPHRDKLADFKSSVGGDLQLHRLFTDIKFRDTWMQFESIRQGRSARSCTRWP